MVDTDLKAPETVEAPPSVQTFNSVTQRPCPEPYMDVGDIAVPRTELEELLIISGQSSLTVPFSRGLP